MSADICMYPPLRPRPSRVGRVTKPSRKLLRSDSTLFNPVPSLVLFGSPAYRSFVFFFLFFFLVIPACVSHVHCTFTSASCIHPLRLSNTHTARLKLDSLAISGGLDPNLLDPSLSPTQPGQLVLNSAASRIYIVTHKYTLCRLPSSKITNEVQITRRPPVLHKRPQLSLPELGNRLK